MPACPPRRLLAARPQPRCNPPALASPSSSLQVWKDVDGVLTSDPRIVSGTRPVNELTFEEATELAYFGAQVLHPQAMQPAIRSGKLNVRVKNSYNRCVGVVRVLGCAVGECGAARGLLLGPAAGPAAGAAAGPAAGPAAEPTAGTRSDPHTLAKPRPSCTQPAHTHPCALPPPPRPRPPGWRRAPSSRRRAT